jgi:CheY-like chemotaxis protein
MEQLHRGQLFASCEIKPEPSDLDALRAMFIQNVSHEFRTPLGIIQGYAELLHDGDLGELAPEQKRAMFVIVNRAYELRKMVERIGTLLQTESQANVTMPLTLTEVATQVVEDRRVDAAQAGLEIEFHLEPDLPLVSGDPYQLQQAVECLVENAIKFTPSDGRIEVAVYTEGTGPEEPDWVCLAVTDTGIGIPEQELGRIFRGFYQVDGSTTRQYGGLGLGLTVARAVVEEHNGCIEVESKPGQGSCFVVKIPALPSDTLVDEPVREGTRLQSILVVDDEEFVVLTLQEGLSKLPNCQVSVATSGQQALELLDQQTFDLLITDYKMPDLDGLTLAEHVRQSHPHTAVIVITGYSDELREHAAHGSIQRILDKPVKLAEIRSVASEALANQGGV